MTFYDISRISSNFFSIHPITFAISTSINFQKSFRKNPVTPVRLLVHVLVRPAFGYSVNRLYLLRSYWFVGWFIIWIVNESTAVFHGFRCVLWQNIINALLASCEPFLAVFDIYPIFLSIYYENGSVDSLGLLIGILRLYNHSAK